MPLVYTIEEKNHDGTFIPFINNICINTTLACNLSCVGCNSFSNMKIDDEATVEQRIEWIKNLKDMCDRTGITVKYFDLLGGDPFVGDNLTPIMLFIRKNWPNSTIVVYTNGLLLKNKQNLIPLFLANNITLKVTIHDLPDSMTNKIYEGMKIWRDAGVFIRSSAYNDYDVDVYKERIWIQTLVYENGKVYPHQDNHKKSWLYCLMRDCHTLSDNKIYHCPITALLPFLLKKTNQLDDPVWQRYLSYKPLDTTTASEEDLIDFFQTTPGEICSMCPSKVTRPKYVPAIASEADKFDLNKWDLKE